MVLFRLSSRDFRPDSGEGARMYGGRWNQAGTPVVYASRTRALAAVEMFAHHRAIPANYRLTVIEVPDDLAIEVVDTAALPPGWPKGNDEAATAAYGTEWANSLRTAVLQVPSAAFAGAGEHNYLLNPRHPEFQRIHFEMAAEEYIDPRLRMP